MRRVLTLSALVFFFASVEMAAGQIDLNMTGSQFEVKAPEALRIRNLTVPGYPGTYWVDFQWNPMSLVFSPTAVGPESSGDPVLAKTELLKGHWHFVETIGTSVFTDDYSLTTIPGSRNSQGGYFINGTDQYGGPVAASYYPNDGNWALLDPSDFIFDNFFVFYTDGASILPGSCYYLVYHDGHWSTCYKLTGVKTAATANARAAQDSSLRVGEEAARAQEVETLGQDTAPVSPDVIEKYMLLKRFTAQP